MGKINPLILSLSLEIPIRIPLAEKDKSQLVDHLKKEAIWWTSKILAEKGDYCNAGRFVTTARQRAKEELPLLAEVERR